MHLVRFSSALIGAALLSAPVVAQTQGASATASKTAHTKTVSMTKTTKTNAPVQRTAKSLDCSKQADAKNVHGRER